MLTPTDQEALNLLNAGAKSYEDSPAIATDLWEKALTCGPSPDIEAIIRGKLVWVLLSPFLDLQEGAALTEEQAERFLQGESHLIHLNSIIDANDAAQKLERLSPDNLSHCQRVLDTYRVLSVRAGQGYFIFPGDASVSRLVEYGYALADADEKEAAVVPLEKALTLVQERQLECQSLVFRAHLRLAALLNDTGRRSEAARHAQWILDSGAASETLMMMMDGVIASARELGDVAPPAREPDCERTPLFFEGMAEILGHKPAGEIWLKVIDREFDSLSKGYQLIALSQACDYLLARKEFLQVGHWAERGLEIALELRPDKSHAPFHTNLLECIAKVAIKNKDFVRAEQVLLEAVEIPHARTLYIYELLSVVGFASGDAKKGGYHLLQLVNHPDFSDALSDDSEKIGGLFTLTFLGMKDGSINEDGFRQAMLEAWRKTEAMWSSADASNPKLHELRDRAKELQKSRCFIASACCTGPYSSWIADFVEFRDSILRRSIMGQLIIRGYELTSPPIADLLANSSPLRKAALRLILAPLHALTKLWLVRYRTSSRTNMTRRL